VAVSAQQAPTFRSRVDLVHLDVSVLDGSRRPVKGLGPSDFMLLEDDKPQQIAVFSAVDVPPTAPPQTGWMRDVARDVRTNQDVADRRLFTIIIDDARMSSDLPARKRMGETARKLIDGFGPSDLVSVIFTMDNRNSQDFTSDRARLLAAVDRATMGMSDAGGMSQMFSRMSVGVIEQSVASLSELPDRRKVIIYIGEGVPVDLETVAAPIAMGFGTEAGVLDAASAMRRNMDMMSEAFRNAARANINIYTLDICGLRVPPVSLARTCVQGREVDYMQNLASSTGGRAAVNTNDLGPAVEKIFEENASYYLLGYQPSDPATDGKYRRLEVRVNRPGLLIRTRSGYNPEKPKDAEKRRAAMEKKPLGAALSGLLPKGDLPLDLTAAAFAIPGKSEAAVAVTLGVHQPIRESSVRKVERVDFLVSAFNTDGKFFGAKRLNADVTIRADAQGLAFYEAQARLDLKPGRYQLRVAGNIGSITTSGSLYYDVDVPNFEKAPVSLSGLALVANPPAMTAPRDAFKALLPVMPTTKRAFDAGGQAVAFIRVYQGGNKPMIQVPLTVRIRNERDELVMDRLEQLPVTLFTAERSADVNIGLPLGRLTPGEYLLTIETGLGTAVARRTSRFSVR